MNNLKARFKTHMILMADNEGFTTFCGIDDGCSEDFFDASPLVEFGNKEKTTCKNCLAKWAKEEAQMIEQERILRKQALELT